jgi:hypothetical protein
MDGEECGHETGVIGSCGKLLECFLDRFSDLDPLQRALQCLANRRLRISAGFYQRATK